MAEARVATVDAYVLRRTRGAWELLLLRRAAGTRCTAAWEGVHGRIERDELPEDAAVREVREETGLAVERLYNVAVQPFYLHDQSIVTLAVAFAAVVAPASEAVLAGEHDEAAWVPLAAAGHRLAWPRSRAAVADIAILLATGDAGPVEDVLRIL